MIFDMISFYTLLLRLVIISIMLATIYKILNFTLLVFLELVIICHVLSTFDVSVSDGSQEVVGKEQKMISS